MQPKINYPAAEPAGYVMDVFFVIPAKAGIHFYLISWTPAYAGVTYGNPVASLSSGLTRGTPENYQVKNELKYLQVGLYIIYKRDILK